MTKAQNRLYWREWAKTRRALIGHGRTKAEADQERHLLHEKALGYDKSHLDFTNTEFDKILGVFRSWSSPADLNAQMRQQDQPAKRSKHVYDQIIGQINELHPDHDIDQAYVEALAKKMCKTALCFCEAQQIQKIIAALNYHLKRRLIDRILKLQRDIYGAPLMPRKEYQKLGVKTLREDYFEPLQTWHHQTSQITQTAPF